MAKTKKANGEDPEIVEGSDSPEGQVSEQDAVEKSAAPAPAEPKEERLSDDEIARRRDDIWKSHQAVIAQTQIESAARQFPAVADLVAENAKLKSELNKAKGA